MQTTDIILESLGRVLLVQTPTTALKEASARLRTLQELVNLAYPLVYGMETHGSPQKLLWQKNWLEAAAATGASID